MNNRQPVSAATTTIYDDRPKQRTIRFLFALLIAVVFVSVAAYALIDALHIEERAQLALAAARQVGDATRYYKVLFIIVFWLDFSLVVTAGAVSVSAMLGAYAWRSVRAALEPGYISGRLADKSKVRRIEQ